MRRGRCLGVLGPNGAGKTTTIEIVEGLKPADAGSVRILGRTWDDDALSKTLAGLKEADVEVQDLGWDQAELDTILNVVPAFEPTGSDDQHDLDQLQPKLCPHCGKDTREHPKQE